MILFLFLFNSEIYLYLFKIKLNMITTDTLNTIKYADRAKSIRSDLKKRVIEREMHVGKYKEIIQSQKAQIKRLQGLYQLCSIDRLYCIVR